MRTLMDAESVLLSVLTPEGRANPHPSFAELRRLAPIHRSEALDTHFLTRFAECHAVLTNHEFLVPDLTWCSSNIPDWREHPAADFFYSSLLGSNGAVHDRLRRPVARAFGVRRIAALRRTVEKITEELLDGFAEATSSGGAANFQELVGDPLPVAVAGGLIGVPRADQEHFHRLGRDASRLLEPVRTADDWARADGAVDTLREYFTGLLRERRARPADDFASALHTQHAPGDTPLTERERVDILLLLFVAGFETTSGMLGLTVFALLTHPGELALVRADPDLATAAVEESLRWDTPVVMTERIAARPLELAPSVTVPEGASVTAVLTAANRDPGHHPDPDAFTVRRQGTRVLSFSAGTHFCPGAALARSEGAALVRRLVHRFPGLGLAGEPVRRASVSLRSFDDLPLVTTG
ncbi:cytochrome P450 [Streptomyces sp. NPDC051567]|uniref:cytochrome P450 n=1 Tax=Streptomyces sp. NPDC051567 TaxID=3365660 RepID=UPI0037B53FFD